MVAGLVAGLAAGLVAPFARVSATFEPLLFRGMTNFFPNPWTIGCPFPLSRAQGSLAGFAQGSIPLPHHPHLPLDFFPHIFVWGSCFLLCAPVRRLALPFAAIYSHTVLSHTTPSHTTLSRTTPSHTTLSHTTPSHTTLSHTTLSHTQHPQIDFHFVWQVW